MRPIRLAATLVKRAELTTPGIHVVRGPRQAGKSTDLKLLVSKALAAGREPATIIYLALDLLEDQPIAAFASTVRRAKQLAISTHEPSLVLLDEVTTVKGWQTAVKALWDDGTIRHDVIYCTGSSTTDLRSGAAERLPGRRGSGSDHLVLPQSFASFASAVDKSVPASPQLDIGDLFNTSGRDLLSENQLHLPSLDRAFERYLVFGGLPAAVAEAASGAGTPSRETKRIVWDSLIKEINKHGASVPAARALLERVVRSLGSKTSWAAMAREMDVPLKRSGRNNAPAMRDYIEYLADGYFVFITYFWQKGAALSAQSNDKKVFFADPLLHTLALDHMAGHTPDIPALVENVVGATLLRRYEPVERLVESFALPDRLHVWQTSGGGEIDFVCGPNRAGVDVVEVKYQQHPKRNSAASAAAAHPGRPVIMVTKRTLELDHDRYLLVPASLFLWALGQEPGML